MKKIRNDTVSQPIKQQGIISRGELRTVFDTNAEFCTQTRICAYCSGIYNQTFSEQYQLMCADAIRYYTTSISFCRLYYYKTDDFSRNWFSQNYIEIALSRCQSIRWRPIVAARTTTAVNLCN